MDQADGTGYASGPMELIVIGILALAIVLIAVLMLRSMRRIQIPRDPAQHAAAHEEAAAHEDADAAQEPAPAAAEDTTPAPAEDPAAMPVENPASTPVEKSAPPVGDGAEPAPSAPADHVTEHPKST